MFIEFVEERLEIETPENKEMEMPRIRDLYDDLKQYADEESIYIPRGFSRKELQKYILKTYKKYDNIKIIRGVVHGMKLKNIENLNDDDDEYQFSN